ncbi:nucleotidyltransferase domain-containing protein [Fictibacillus nanhaiensis]|uniref:Nucleotidyltransferase domain-containing protein n=1 Tax=Fictibacillus nanhaiensis TaxID=742169 RepID=A0ABS2ZMF6_9BACL|nr:nucleotidyltransferase domain-containing protein [Fictibacillus nanhaiensis]
MLEKVEEIFKHPEIILQHIPWVDIENSMIYIGGSVMEGFGNATSDIDVFVISSDDPTSEDINLSNEEQRFFEGMYSLVHNIIHEGIRYDFTYWNSDKVNHIKNSINNIDLNTDFQMVLNKGEIDFLHRLKYAKSIINHAEFSEFLKTINFDNLRYYIAVTESQAFAGTLEDLQGAFISKDYGTAFFRAKRLVEITFTALLALHGETNPNVKWLYRKLQRLSETTGDFNYFSKFMELQNSNFDPATVKIYIRECVKYCQEINIGIQEQLKTKQEV